MTVSITTCFLTLVWVLATGRVDAMGVLTGLAVALVLTALLRHGGGPRVSPRALLHAPPFAWLYLLEFTRSCLRVARQVFRAPERLRPAVIEVPLGELAEHEVAALANLLSYSPGSLCLDVSDDGRRMYVHIMDVDDAEDVARHVREDLERAILRVLR